MRNQPSQMSLNHSCPVEPLRNLRKSFVNIFKQIGSRIVRSDWNPTREITRNLDNLFLPSRTRDEKLHLSSGPLTSDRNAEPHRRRRQHVDRKSARYPGAPFMIVADAQSDVE